jgi:uncharacterized membrane protein YkoI
MKRRTANALCKFFLCVGIFISVPFYARADEKPVRMKNLPKAVQQTVEEQSKGATILGLSRETENGKTYYEVELKVNGHHKDVLIDAAGAVVESEEEVEVEALPPAVKSAIEKLAGKGKIVMVESITKNGNIVAYEAHIKNGRKTKEIKVGTDGELNKD